MAKAVYIMYNFQTTCIQGLEERWELIMQLIHTTGNRFFEILDIVRDLLKNQDTIQTYATFIDNHCCNGEPWLAGQYAGFIVDTVLLDLEIEQRVDEP